MSESGEIKVLDRGDQVTRMVKVTCKSKIFLQSFKTEKWQHKKRNQPFSCLRVWSSEIPLSESMEIFGISQFMFGQP